MNAPDKAKITIVVKATTATAVMIRFLRVRETLDEEGVLRGLTEVLSYSGGSGIPRIVELVAVVAGAGIVRHHGRFFRTGFCGEYSPTHHPLPEPHPESAPRATPRALAAQ